jgi:aryl-alcohol dehydrogenase-like predicted oxidoreductase
MAMGNNPSYADTYRAMEKLMSKRKAKALGVSNFNKQEIQDILDQCDIVSMHLDDERERLTERFIRPLQCIRWSYIVSETDACSQRTRR